MTNNGIPQPWSNPKLPKRAVRAMGKVCAALPFLLALAACSQEQPVDEPVVPPESGTSIAFIANQGEESTVTRAPADNSATRAATGLETVLPDGDKVFRVWGFKNTAAEGGTYTSYQTVMNGYTVRWAANSAATTTTNTHDWEYVNQQSAGEDEQTIKYWDWSAGAYRFFGATNWGGVKSTAPHEANKAYGDIADDGSAYEVTMAIDLTSLRSIDAMPYYSHLWFSNGDTAEGCQPFGQPVWLEFLKPYSRVRFMYNYVFEREDILMESQEFKPTADYGSVSPAGIARKGTFTVSYPLTGTATTETCTMEPVADGKLAAFFEDYDPDDATKEYLDSNNGWYYVFPNTTQGSYTLAVTINRDEKTCTVPAEYMHWLPGYSYTYVFKINDQGGVEIDMVQSAVTTWTEMNIEHSVYNW